MPTANDQHVTELAEISSAEMTQIQGGAWYAKFDGVDGSSAQAGSAGYSDWRQNFGRTS